VQILAEMLSDYKRRNIFVCFSKLRRQVKDLFVKAGVLDSLDDPRAFPTTDQALRWVEANVLGQEEGLSGM
jgi:hypothetical protein